MSLGMGMLVGLGRTLTSILSQDGRGGKRGRGKAAVSL